MWWRPVRGTLPYLAKTAVSCDALLARCWCGAAALSAACLTGVALLSVERPVICQMQQLLVSMETTRGPFFLFLAPLCVKGKAVGGQEEMVVFRESERTKWHFDCMFFRREE